MAQAINCNYSRTAIRELCQEEFVVSGTAKRLPHESLVKVVERYNIHFSEQQLQLSLDIAKKRVRPLLTLFTKKWYPESQKPIFLDTFSLNAWNHLPLEEKHKHSLQQCVACHTQQLSLTRAFPYKKGKAMLQHEQPVIAFNEQDLASPSNLGRKALQQLNNICEDKFKRSVQDVITETPKSKLIRKPSSREQQDVMRKTVRQTKKVIQQSMDSTSTSTVMSNRISWRKFDKIRTAETLENSSAHSVLDQTPSRKRKNPPSDENTPSSKRKHGSPTTLSKTAEEDLLAEARSWSDNETVNWSSLARRYAMTKANAGQSIKEFLRSHNILTASKEQRKGRSHRRKRKLLPGGIPFPMQHHSAFHKKELQSGEINLGVSVAPTCVSSYSYSKADNKVVETTSTVYAKKIPLLDIRRKSLEKHEKMGIIRNCNLAVESESPSDQASTSGKTR